MIKKYVWILIAAVLVMSLTGCGKTDTAKTPAQTIIADFLEKSGTITTAEAMAEALAANPVLPFLGASMAVEPGYLNGFTGTIEGFREGAMFGPAIGAIPFIGYVFILDEGVNADDFTAGLKQNADLRWNVCTQAEEMAYAVSGNAVCFVMSPSSFEE